MSDDGYAYGTSHTVIVHEVQCALDGLDHSGAEEICAQLGGARIGLIAAAFLAGLTVVTSLLGVAVLILVNADDAELSIVAARSFVAFVPAQLAFPLLIGLITTIYVMTQQFERPTIAGFEHCLRRQARLWRLMAILAWLGAAWILALPWAFRWLT